MTELAAECPQGTRLRAATSKTRRALPVQYMSLQNLLK